jgi:hypothetical protein
VTETREITLVGCIRMRSGEGSSSIGALPILRNDPLPSPSCTRDMRQEALPLLEPNAEAAKLIRNIREAPAVAFSYADSAMTSVGYFVIQIEY